MGAQKEIRSTAAAKILPENRFHSFQYSTSDITSNVCSSSVLQLQQVKMWRGYDLPLTDWEKVSDAYFIPIMSDRDVALNTLLEVIKCCCKTGGSTMRCSCYTANLHCSHACGECRGVYANISVDQEGTYIITRQSISTIFFG